MQHRPGRTIAAVVGLGLICALAVSAPSRPTLLFRGTFDGSGTSPYPEAGQFVSSSAVGGIGVLPSLGGGNVLVFDDSKMGGKSTLFLHGTFENSAVAYDGVVRYTFNMEVQAADLPFQAGIVIDNPTSDFIPATGPGDQGTFIMGGKNTNQKVKVGVVYNVNIFFRRKTATQDWQYEISANPAEPPDTALGTPAMFPVTGTLAGTARAPISGIAFVKDAGRTGVIQIDDIEVVQSP